MATMLAENLRRLRKERGLTQEQLAEVVGVTAGAVHKWEARLSVPDLEMIVELADFFDSSVDALLGYRIKDNRLQQTLRRLKDCRRRKDRAGLAEAEKALKKYPHSFEVVYAAASLFGSFGFEARDRALSRRALELLEQARLLLPQNKDPKISEQTIYRKMAITVLSLGEREKAIELWKAHNADGINNHHLGSILAQYDRLEEAEVCLSEALSQVVGELCDVVIGFFNLFCKRGDYDSAEAILRLGISFCTGLRKEGTPNYLDKVTCISLAALGGTQLLAGKAEEARRSLEDARTRAAAFDAAPSDSKLDIRFITCVEDTSAYDDIGATAMDAVQNAVGDFESEELTALWRSVKEQEGSDE